MNVLNNEQSTEEINCGPLPLHDVNSTGVGDKVVNSILHVHHFSTSGDTDGVDSEI